MSGDLTDIRETIDERLATFNQARQRVRKEADALATAEQMVESVVEAQQLAQQVAQGVQEHAHRQIAGVVSRCLEAVFDEPYDFRIHFERKRGRTEARLSFHREGVEVDPMTASGGGVVDVASFALRLSCLMLAQPPLRRVMILDEPFKFVSAEYIDRVRILLEQLAKEMKVQFIMVTHIDELKTGKVVDLS